MGAELSITLNRLKKEAKSVIGSGRSNAQAVADVLHQRVVPGEGQPTPDFLAVQLGLVRMVETELAQIETRDESLVDDLDEDRDLLDERIAATAETSEVLDAVQSACRGVFGAQASRKLFGQVETLPRDPEMLHKLGKRVHRRLADVEYALPEPRLSGWPLADRQALADELGGPVERLGRALEGLNSERKDSDNTRFFKSGALEGLRRTVRHAAGFLASLYGLAGFDALAEKIRPKRRRRRNAGGSGEQSGNDANPATESAESAESAAMKSPESAEPSESPAPESAATESPESAANDDSEGAEPRRPTGPTLVVN